MQNEIYRGVAIPARESKDGESPTMYIVTEENNGFALFFESFDDCCLVEWSQYGKNTLIEKAVQKTLKLRLEHETEKALKELENKGVEA